MPRGRIQPLASAVFLNPALVALLQAAMARSYEEERGEAMVWPLATVLPIMVLHRSTRLALPKTKATHLSTWTVRNPGLCAGFGPRVSSMLPVTREGLRFGLRHSLLALEAGTVHGLPPRRKPKKGELGDLVKAAQLVGRWTASVNQPSTVFSLLGVRP
ncbi:three component ABC system middle component [Streptomyces anandii]|uniref:three component ABC system middle component n=1 Tax=Streptomyces anandii TaxID=285454 RepID=UPI0036FA14DE